MKTKTPAKRYGKTPNALPPNVLSLGEVFQNAAITEKMAESIIKIDVCGPIGSKSSKNPDGTRDTTYPYSLIDIWHVDPSGETHILARSKHLKVNQKQLRSLMRATIRKVAVFMFERKEAKYAR